MNKERNKYNYPPICTLYPTIITVSLFILISIPLFLVLNLYGPAIVEVKTKIHLPVSYQVSKLSEIKSFYAVAKNKDALPIIDCQIAEEKDMLKDPTTKYCTVRYYRHDYSTWHFGARETYWDRYPNKLRLILYWILMLISLLMFVYTIKIGSNPISGE